MKDRRKITSVKPGRAQSFMGGIGSIIAIIFGIFWTVMASEMTGGIGGPASFFPLFGVIFILAGVANAIYSFSQATSKERHSLIDITDSETEPDPLNERFGNRISQDEETELERIATAILKEDGSPLEDGDDGANYCPYCGKAVDDKFSYCPSCGKELPK